MKRAPQCDTLRGWCGALKMVVCYFEKGGLVLKRGWCGTLKRVVCYFEEGGGFIHRKTHIHHKLTDRRINNMDYTLPCGYQTKCALGLLHRHSPRINLRLVIVILIYFINTR